METIRNLDAIKTELRRRQTETEAKAAAWRRVTFNTKKDGKPFARLQANIDGAKVETPTYAMRPEEKRLCVYCGHVPTIGYTSDEINLYEIARYMKDPAKRAKLHNLIPKSGLLEALYVYDLDDVKSAIAARIAQLDACAAAYRAQLDAADAAYTTFKAAYSAALDALKQETDAYTNSALYDLIRKTVTTCFPYC